MSDFKISTLQVDLQKKTASVVLRDPVGGGLANVAGIAYDQPGEQTETEIRKLALDAVRSFLQKAAAANFVD